MEAYLEFSYGKNEKIIGKISLDDFDLVLIAWGKSNGYAQGCQSNEYKNKLIHRVIMERVLNRKLGRYEFVDHKNRNRSDNRRSNLRLGDNSLNQANKICKVNKYKGVYFDKHAAKNNKTKIYKASVGITVNGKKKTINAGFYRTPEEAAKAYDKKAIEMFGEFARINFP